LSKWYWLSRCVRSYDCTSSDRSAIGAVECGAGGGGGTLAATSGEVASELPAYVDDDEE
jgi:hypothetical protein